MSKEVLLMQKVEHLGEEGDVVVVADGYARNYLFPKSLAAPVTEATRRQLAKLQRERETETREALRAAQEKANQLQSVSVTIPVKTGEDEKMYGSVTTSDIAEALATQGLVLERHLIDLEHPIKELGVFDVKVKLHPDVDSAVKVWVVEE